MSLPASELKALVEMLRNLRAGDPLARDIRHAAADALEAMGANVELLAETNRRQHDDIILLRLQVEALRKDAGRYQYWREHTVMVAVEIKDRAMLPTPELVDAIIDAALTPSGAEK